MDSHVLFGISNAHYAIRNDDGTYETPKPMPWAVQMAVSNSGGTGSDKYADNKKVYSGSAASGKSGDLQATEFAEDFLTNVLGQKKEDGGGVSEGPSDQAKEFAFLWETGTNGGGRRRVWFSCTATTPTNTDATNTDTLTFGDETITVTASPTEINGEKKTQYTCHTGDANYDDFFKAVPLTTPGA